MKKLILSVDGGGVRGVIPAMAVARLEQVTGKLARETVSFAAGTSTGALIAACIAAGVPGKEMVDVYMKRAKEIFSPGAPWNAIKRVVTGSQYSTEKLRKVIANTLGVNWKLNDCPIDVLITAVRVCDSKPWYFVKDNVRNAKTTGSLLLVDCATASASAPTYFPSYLIPACGKLADGGVGVAGNPVYQSCIEAFKYNVFYAPADTVIVSLGTGRYISEQNPSGLLGWLTWTLDTLLNAPEDQQTQLVERHFSDCHLFRRDCTLPSDIPMDGADKMDELAAVGQKFAAQVPWELILQEL